MFKNKLYTVNDTLNQWEFVSLEVTKGTCAKITKLYSINSMGVGIFIEENVT